MSITVHLRSRFGGPDPAAIDKEVEEADAFRAGNVRPSHERLELLPARARHQRDGRAFERRVADLNDFLSPMFESARYVSTRPLR
jgi:hypothetical protein